MALNDVTGERMHEILREFTDHLYSVFVHSLKTYKNIEKPKPFFLKILVIFPALTLARRPERARDELQISKLAQGIEHWKYDDLTRGYRILKTHLVRKIEYSKKTITYSFLTASQIQFIVRVTNIAYCYCHYLVETFDIMTMNMKNKVYGISHDDVFELDEGVTGDWLKLF